MSSRVLTFVLGHEHNLRVPASLRGFRRYQIEGRSYPALCTSLNLEDTVDGILLEGLNESDIQRLDDFEGTDYVRTLVEVKKPDGSPVKAFTYIWSRGHNDPTLYGNWSFERDFAPKEDATLKEWGFL